MTDSSPWRRGFSIGVFAFAVVLSLGLLACDDDSTRPGTDAFLLDITVARPDGTPVPDAQVVVWNMSSSLAGFLQDSVFSRRAVTDVRFTLDSPGLCWLRVYDLEGNLVQTAHDGAELPAGTHTYRIAASLTYEAGVEVHRYELVVQDPDTGSERYRAEHFMTAVHLDRTRLAPTITDANGRVRITDPTFVPGLYELGPQPGVNELGDGRGQFTLGDSLAVRVYDDQGQWAQTWAVVSEGRNVIAIEWVDPVAGDPNDGSALVPAAPRSKAATFVPDVPTEDRLYQNSPNPFN